MRAFYYTLFLLLTACVTTSNSIQPNNSWQGQSSSALLQAWGNPNLIIPDTNGSTRYVYITETRESYPSSKTTNAPTAVISGGKIVPSTYPIQNDRNNFYTLKCTTEFQIDAQKNIVAMKQQGQGCKP